MRGGATARLAVAATRAFSATAAAGGVSMVQGASRGIGLEFVSPPQPRPQFHLLRNGPSVPPSSRLRFSPSDSLRLRRLGQVRQLLRRSEQGRVVATCRAPDSATELHKLKEGHAPGRLTVLPLDVTDESTVEVMYSF
jgi:hypothetical protein